MHVDFLCGGGVTLRCDIAIRHLAAGRLSVEAIAQEVGFSSAASFHKAFPRWMGDTPGVYRRTPDRHS